MPSVGGKSESSPPIGAAVDANTRRLVPSVAPCSSQHAFREATVVVLW